MATLKTRLILRNDVSANWADVVLLKGEAGVEWYQGTGDSDGDQTKDTNETAAKPKIKIGDGFTAWSALPYIQEGFISTEVGTTGTGNTVVDASVAYDATTGIYSITLTKANRVVDISATDDDVVVLTVPTKNWSTGHTIDAKHKIYHASTVPSTTATTAGNVTPSADHTINVPAITIDKYGHTTAIGNKAVTIKAHDITLTPDTMETAASADALTIVGLTKGDNHEIKYEEGYRLTRKDTTELTAGTILLGNGGYDVKTSSKQIESTLTNSDAKVPTSKAVYDEVQKVLAIANAAMTLVGTLGDSASGATHTSLKTASEDQLGDAYKVIKADTYGGITAAVGDLIVCYKPTSTTYAWILIPSGDDIEDTWRAVNLDDAQKLGMGTSTGALNLKNVTTKSVSITYDGGFEFDVKTGYTTSGKNYAVTKDGSGNLYVNVPWSNTTYSAATASKLGLVKLGSDTKQTTAANDVTSTADRTYAIQFNSSNQMVVNVPWTDTRDPGYGKITVGVNSTAVTNPANYTTAITLEAVKHNEKVTISPSNKWIRLNATNNGEDADTMTIGHATSGVTANTYGQSAAKTLVWKEPTDAADVNTFTVVKPTVDAAGHITAISNITVTIPDGLVTTSRRGLAPKASVNSFLVTKNGATDATWEQVLIIDGGNASTTTWGIIS